MATSGSPEPSRCPTSTTPCRSGSTSSPTPTRRSCRAGHAHAHRSAGSSGPAIARRRGRAQCAGPCCSVPTASTARPGCWSCSTSRSLRRCSWTSGSGPRQGGGDHSAANRDTREGQRALNAATRLPGDAQDARIHPFVGVHPWRQVRSERTKDVETVLDLVRLTIEKYGFVGVKLYPPMGFEPNGNTETTFDRVTAMTAADAAEVDQALRKLYHYCSDNDVPVTAHCNHSNGAHESYHPASWACVVEEFSSLRLHLRHFGGASEFRDKERTKRNDWTKRVAALVLEEKDNLRRRRQPPHRGRPGRPRVPGGARHLAAGRAPSRAGAVRTADRAHRGRGAGHGRRQWLRPAGCGRADSSTAPGSSPSPRRRRRRRLSSRRRARRPHRRGCRRPCPGTRTGPLCPAGSPRSSE